MFSECISIYYVEKYEWTYSELYDFLWFCENLSEYVVV